MKLLPTPRSFAVLLALSLPACTEPAPEQLATAVFEKFQDALFAADQMGLRGTLSRLSLEALPQIPLERAQGKQRLLLTGVRAAPPQYLIDVRDPNEKGARSTFVVVREDGRYVVDLVATAGHHQVADPNAKREWRIEPGTVSRRDVEAAAAAVARGTLRPTPATTKR